MPKYKHSIASLTFCVFVFLCARIQLSFNDSAELSSNIDNPEGGLEALLQVAVCTNVSLVSQSGRGQEGGCGQLVGAFVSM